MTDGDAPDAHEDLARVHSTAGRNAWAFAEFMAGALGRSARIVVGLIVIVVGVAVDSLIGWIVAAIGVIPVLAGVFNVCLVGPLLGVPFSGRAALEHGEQTAERSTSRQ